MPPKLLNNVKTASRKPAKMRVLRRLPELRRITVAWQTRRESLALVPTMGALHAGHLALVKLAKRRCKRVVVSIFVNPAQFAPNEDFGSYPRTWDADIAALKALGVDAVWAPAVTEMYPEGFAVAVEPGGAAKVGLEDAFRPHFFGGVATVVTKLLLQVRPDVAVFGAEGLPAAQGRDRDGARPRHPDENRRRADPAREGRPRDVVAQQVPVRGGTRDRADVASCAEGMRGAHRRGRRDPGRARGRPRANRARRVRGRLPGGAPRRDAGAGRGSRRTARSGCWSRPGSAAPG